MSFPIEQVRLNSFPVYLFLVTKICNRIDITKQKQQKRQNLYDMAEKQTHEVVSSPQNYLNYLEMQSKFGYTVTNTLLVMAQCPQATLLKDNNRWVEEKKYVKKGVKGIGILEPKGEYQGNDGVIRTNYDVKYVFDISQLNTHRRPCRPLGPEAEAGLLEKSSAV